MSRARRTLVPLATPLVALWLFAALAPTAASAQSESPSQVAARVHEAGGYPDDVLVLDDESGRHDADGTGAGGGPTGVVHPSGDRDGGDPQRGLDLPIPQFVRDLLRALADMIGTAAQTLTYILFAVGLALLVIFVVYLVTLLRFPKADLALQRRGLRPEAAPSSLDPWLEESLGSPDEYAREGRFREAIHALFVRALGEVARRSDVDRRGRTAREVVSAIRRAEEAPAELDSLLGLAELVWFGGRPATAEQYAHAVALAARIGTRPPAARREVPLRPEAP